MEYITHRIRALVMRDTIFISPMRYSLLLQNTVRSLIHSLTNTHLQSIQCGFSAFLCCDSYLCIIQSILLMLFCFSFVHTAHIDFGHIVHSTRLVSKTIIPIRSLFFNYYFYKNNVLNSFTSLFTLCFGCASFYSNHN